MARTAATTRVPLAELAFMEGTSQWGSASHCE
jgi:hypothetical protein